MGEKHSQTRERRLSKKLQKLAERYDRLKRNMKQLRGDVVKAIRDDAADGVLPPAERILRGGERFAPEDDFRVDPRSFSADRIDGELHAGGCCIPFSSEKCLNPFHLRLGQLNQNLNFQLFGLKGCRVEVEYECRGGNDEVKGVVCDVGTDFISVLKDNGVVATILKERICKIDWKDSCCNPCSCRCHHGHDGGHGRCKECGCSS
ncbi:hypothetical protein [Paenibacillus sp.]|uniref:hypothetical protein n=1 Tax=Paenibacillus sp. TaxID=58172 RepID=UPI002D362A8A|nr:hypothetical protein [Paenibacillus sp.]HZG83486.1 hypothetical protein [Paenibacillus sp.]